MKQGKYSEEQIVRIVKEADAGVKIGDLCRKYGFGEATYYNKLYITKSDFLFGCSSGAAWAASRWWTSQFL